MRVLKRLGFVMTALVMILIVLMYKGDLPASEVDAKYANKHSRFLDIASGARIHYRDEGNPLGLPLVLVHGSNASLHTWEPWVQRLGNEFRVITLDLPGHGLTGRVVGDDYSSVAFVERSTLWLNISVSVGLPLGVTPWVGVLPGGIP